MGEASSSQAGNAVRFFSKPENSQGEERKTQKKRKSRLTKMTELFILKSRMIIIIRHSEIKLVG